MAARSPRRRQLSASVAAIERHNGPDDTRIAPLRRELEVESLAEHAAKVAPVLTPGERARIISEIAGSAPPLAPEDAATLRGLLPLGALVSQGKHARQAPAEPVNARAS